MPAPREVEPEREAPESPVPPVAPRDRALERAAAGVELPVARARPGIDREEVVAADQAQQPFRRIRSEAREREDPLADLGALEAAVFPLREIDPSGSDAARER